MSNLVEINQLRYLPAGQTQPILEGINLTIQAGECVALIGANGSGKTTLIRHINGLLLPTSGSVLVDGLDTSQRANLADIRQKVGMVFQHPVDQITASTIEEDVAFGLENMGLPTHEIRRRVDEALRTVGLSDAHARPPHNLSEGQIQRLALAGVLAMHPQMIIFDETTAMLDPLGRQMVMDQIKTLHQQGLTILYITHSMEEAAQAARVIVLHQGKIVQDATPQQVFNDAALLARCHLAAPRAAQLAKRLLQAGLILPEGLLTRKQLLAAIPTWQGERIKTLPAQTAGAQTAVIAVNGLSHAYNPNSPLRHLALQSVNFQVSPASIHGLAGATGSGKSTLLQHLNGIIRPQSGTVRVQGFLLHDAHTQTRDVIRHVGLVFQNPDAYFFQQYVGDEIAYGPRQLKLAGSLKTRVQQAMIQVGLDFEQFKDRQIATLSGGEKRKAALAAMLAIQPEILLLDEPTAGLDPQATAEILARLIDFKQAGMTLVVSSHQMETLAEICGRMTVLQRGQVVLDGSSQAVFGNNDGLSAAQLRAPLAAQVAEKMRQQGFALPQGIITADALMAALGEE